MTRGSVTLAVGKNSYYQLANNLLRSYRITNTSCTHMSWTIVCDRENKWTADFDDVILLDQPTLSYMDKLKLFSLCPYDECIFIDADCLIFKDISSLWKHMNDVDGFSCFGKALPLNSQDGWFLLDDIGEWKDKISFIPQMHGGLCYIKRGEKLNEILCLAEYIEKHYTDYKFKYFEKPADEPILALAMAIAGSRPLTAKPEYFAFLPTVDKICLNEYISDQTRICIEKGKKRQEVWVIHYQNHNTEKTPYKVTRDVVVKHRGYFEYLSWVTYAISDYVRPWCKRIYNFLADNIRCILFR